MEHLLEEFDLQLEKAQIVDVSIFDDDKLAVFDEPYKSISFDNTNIKYKIVQNDDTNTSTNTNSNIIENTTNNTTDEKNETKTDIENELEKVDVNIKKLHATLRSDGIEFQYAHSFSYDFTYVLIKKTLAHITNKYNIITKELYVYTTLTKIINFFGSLDYKYKTIHVNKIINKTEDSYILFFNFYVSIYEKSFRTIIKYIIDVINLLKTGGNIVLKILYVPFRQLGYSFYLLLTSCFKKVEFIYSLWEDDKANIVYIVLIDKLHNIKFDHKKEINDIIIQNTNNVDNIRIKLLNFMNDIFGYIIFKCNLNYSLFNYKKININLYTKYITKLMSKIITD
jgi:hypothetical protein